MRQIEGETTENIRVGDYIRYNDNELVKVIKVINHHYIDIIVIEDRDSMPLGKSRKGLQVEYGLACSPKIIHGYNTPLWRVLNGGCNG